MKKLLFLFFFIVKVISKKTYSLKETCSVTQSLRRLSEQLIQDKLNEHFHQVVKITLGGQYMKVRLSTSFCGLWLFNHATMNRGFKPDQSSTLVQTNTQDKMEYVSGTVAYDKFEADDAVVNNLPFLLVDKAHEHVLRLSSDGILGYGYSCEDELSRIDLLNYQSHQDKSRSNVISFLIFKDSEDGYLDIGLYPPKLHLYPKYYKTSKVGPSNLQSQWNIHLDSIYFEDNTYIRINDYLSVGINGNIFSVKKDFFDWFVQAFFSKQLSDNQCAVNIDGVYELLCDFGTEMPKIGVMSFVVGKWNFKVDGAKLMRIVNRGIKKLGYAVVYYPKHDHFYLPQLYLKGIYLVYDKKKSEIGFMFRPQMSEDGTIK